MKVYCGTDIIEVDRIKKAIQKNERFKTNIFSKFEIEDIESSENEDVKYQRYAGRFASKEAIYKAISKFTVEEDYSPKFLDVEIINDEEFKRRPKVNVISKSLDELFVKYKIKIDLSISHVRENAIAMAVVTIDDKEWKYGE